MSKFTGKCDLYDWFGMIACKKGETPYECYKRLGSRIFMGGQTYTDEVKIEKPSDLVMFYPFVAYAHFSSSDETADARDVHYIRKGSFIADTVRYNPAAAARELQELLDEYWRVKNEEDPRYT